MDRNRTHFACPASASCHLTRPAIHTGCTRAVETGITFFSLPSFILMFLPPSLVNPGTAGCRWRRQVERVRCDQVERSPRGHFPRAERLLTGKGIRNNVAVYVSCKFAHVLGFCGLWEAGEPSGETLTPVRSMLYLHTGRCSGRSRRYRTQRATYQSARRRMRWHRRDCAATNR